MKNALKRVGWISNLLKQVLCISRRIPSGGNKVMFFKYERPVTSNYLPPAACHFYMLYNNRSRLNRRRAMIVTAMVAAILPTTLKRMALAGITPLWANTPTTADVP